VRWRGALALVVGLVLARAGTAEELIARGEYLTRIGGCFSCHTDTAQGGPSLAGGRALATPFGTFYSPNITPDRETGIGGWTEAQFRRALREGVRPDGANYFPVFPYPSFTNITDDDLDAMWTYLLSRPPVRRPNRPHDIGFPISWRLLQSGWKMLFFTPGPFVTDPAHGTGRARGAYLVGALAHCGECHTPRNRLGAVERSRFLSGTPDGPDGQLVPNITPDRKTGIGDWTKDDLVELLATGTTPEQNKVKGAMREAVQDGLKYLTAADREAIADYLLALPPIAHAVRRQK
jgi:mono/diheme cytochrome c family protein